MEQEPQQPQNERPRLLKGRSNLETWYYIATILVGMPVALLGALIAVVTFVHNSNVQAEDSAYNVVEEHLQLRVETPEVNSLIRKIRVQPQALEDANQVPDSEYDLYRNVASHGLSIAEHIYKTRGDEEEWSATIKDLISEYEPAILYANFVCDEYDFEFVQFVGETLNRTPDEFCVPRDETLVERNRERKESSLFHKNPASSSQKALIPGNFRE